MSDQYVKDVERLLADALWRIAEIKRHECPSCADTRRECANAIAEIEIGRKAAERRADGLQARMAA